MLHKPTESELAVLHQLWSKGVATVREVNEALNTAAAEQGREQEIGYTTTLKIMQIMHEKGMVAREEDGRTHRYRALVREQDTKDLLLQNFVDTAFRGAAMDMVLQALGGHAANRNELDKIKSLIAEMEQKLSDDPTSDHN
jgi:BlaI family transcriptional regulator, penicillinase repressor